MTLNERDENGGGVVVYFAILPESAAQNKNTTRPKRRTKRIEIVTDFDFLVLAE
jgi:hypothetical protein